METLLPPEVVLDTNVILDNNQVLLKDDIRIILPYTVLHELDGLKRNPDLRVTAQQAIKIIKQQYTLKKLEITDIPKEVETNDEKIVQTARTNNAKLWTGDVGASVIAMSTGVELFENTTDDYDSAYIGYSYHTLPSDLYYHVVNNSNELQYAEIEEDGQFTAEINEYVYLKPDDGSLNYKIFRKTVNGYRYISDSKKLFAKLGNVWKQDKSESSAHGLDFEFLHEEQAMAFDAVFNTDTPLAVICGDIGSGKTLISTIAALARTAGSNSNRAYDKILVTRPNRPISKEYEIGFLPGDLDAKMKSWLSGFTSNLEFLYEKNLQDAEMKKAELVFQTYFKPIAIESAQGASFHKSIFLIDEAQLLDELAMRQLMSRIATGSKCVLILDPNQTYGANRGREAWKKLLPRCKGNPLISFINLQHIQRSALTELVKSIF